MTAVRVQDAPGFVVSSTGTQLTAAVPAGATSGTLTVTTPSGTSTARSQTFTVLPPLSVTALNLTRNTLTAPVGTPVTVTP